jgi:hypothetical protein
MFPNFSTCKAGFPGGFLRLQEIVEKLQEVLGNLRRKLQEL